jgi:mercuric ion binding protein
MKSLSIFAGLLLLVFSVLATEVSVSEAAQPSFEEVILSVPDMHCRLCPLTVRKALDRIPGVVDAKADLATKTATVIIQKGRVSVRALEHATAQAGYPSTLKSIKEMTMKM